MENSEISDIDREEKEIESKRRIKKKDLLIKIVFFLVNVFFSVFLISLFLYYGKGVNEIYKNTPELTLATIIILTRIGIMFSFCYYMFKKWFTQEKRYLKNIPFLVGLFFYFSAIGKFLDVLLYIYYFSPYKEADAFFLLAKIRQLFLIITFIPMLYLGLRPFIYNIGLKRGWNEGKVLKIRRGITTTYIFSFGFFISISYTVIIFQILTALMSIITYIFICYLFRFAHKHNTFPTIRADLVSFGFFFYLIATPSNLILSIFIMGFMTYEQINVISESLNFVAMSIIFLGFVLKPK